jgi:EAL domain-containing protein (putative c-di-GMP-specific phosphodiesterase class I)
MLISSIVEDRDALFLAVENLGAISLAFGDDVAAAISDQVRHCAHALSGGNIDLHPLSPNVFTLRHPRSDQGGDRVALDHLCALISATPFHAKGVSAMVILSLHESLDSAQTCLTGYREMLSGDTIARYRSDMAVASQLMRRKSEGGLLMLWRPVRSTRMPDAVLHYEAVSMQLEQNGAYRDCSAERDALQRLGLVWVLDHHNLMAAIDELYADDRPCITVQLAAQSLRASGVGCSGRWLGALRRLKARPDVAGRLVIEITGTFAGNSIQSIKDDVAAFRQLGVSLSVANFASSDMNFGALVALDPDIVKIGAIFMQSAALDASNCRRLQLLFKLATTMSRTVVVEGVDSDKHMQIARVLGAEWVKGQRVGEPSFGRRWRIVPTASGPSALAANCEDDELPPLRRLDG